MRLKALKMLVIGLCVVGTTVYQRTRDPSLAAHGVRGVSVQGLGQAGAADAGGGVSGLEPQTSPAPDSWDGYARGGRRLSGGGCDSQTCPGYEESNALTVWWNVLYWAVLLYAFYGLAVVCDDYFVSSLERISTVLKLSEDVAGATFMAAGSSAPELATSCLDVFVFGNNVGVGTIIGSAVFNILVIIALSAVASDQALVIDWKPLTRDCFFYSVSIALLITFTESDASVNWWESLILVAWYICYILFMTKNKAIFDALDRVAERVVYGPRRRRAEAKRLHRQELANKAALARAAAAIRSGRVVEEEEETKYEFELTLREEQAAAERTLRLRRKFRAAVHAVIIAKLELPRLLYLLKARRLRWADECAKLPTSREPIRRVRLRAIVRTVVLVNVYWPKLIRRARDEGEELNLTEETMIEEATTEMQHNMAQIEEDTRLRLAPVIPLPPPIPHPTRWQVFRAFADKYIARPWGIVLGYTIPDCQEPRWRRWYMVTFFMSIVWIGVLSWLLVEMATRIGCTLGISSVVMGLTVLAAGTSIPDALGSIVVAREGMGNMAVSNAIGSNVFDICLGIGLPYIVKTGIVSPGDVIPIGETKNVEISIGILAGTVALVWLSLVANNWLLTPRVGVFLLIAYAAFIVYTVMKPSEC